MPPVISVPQEGRHLAAFLHSGETVPQPVLRRGGASPSAVKQLRERRFPTIDETAAVRYPRGTRNRATRSATGGCVTNMRAMRSVWSNGLTV